MSTAEKLRQEGIAQGIAQGMAKGRVEERKESLISFVHRAGKQGIPIETIAKIVELDENLIEQILNNENIDIPLHLLGTNR
jgi:predicted transposase YdaD